MPCRRTQLRWANSKRIEPLERRVLFAAGAPDPSFGVGGIAFIDPAVFTGRIAAIAAQADGRVIAVGSYNPGYPVPITAAVARFQPDGTLDATFGGDGIVTLDGLGNAPRLSDVKILSDGDIMAAGKAGGSVLAVRLNADGSPEATFGTNGVSSFALSYGPPDPYGGRVLQDPVSLDVSPTGEAFLAGQVNFNVGGSPFATMYARPAVVKLTANGALDTSFGLPETPGLWTLPADTPAYYSAPHLARDVALQADGRVVVTGDIDDSVTDPEVFVARLTADGRPDPSFSDDGVLRLKFDDDPILRDTANALAIQPDGRVVLAGSASPNNGDQRDFRVARLTTDGRLDPSFGAGGIRPFGFNGPGGMPEEVKLQPDGKIVAAGAGTRYKEPGFVLGRLTSGGAMDLTFGARGRAVAAAPVAFNRYLSARWTDMDFLPDGRIIMVGNKALPDNRFDNYAPVFARFAADDTPIPPPPPPSTGSTTVQAEDSGVLGGAVVGRSNGGYTGTGYVDFVADRGASASWSVSGLPGSGNYVLDFRYANGSKAARPMALAVSPGTAAPDLTFAPTGSWSKWQTASVPVTLAGGNTLSVTLTTTGKNGPNIDSLTVRRADLPPGALRLEAEDATLHGPRVHYAYNGEPFVDFAHPTGDYVEWTFDGTGGSHMLTFVFANGGTYDRPLELTVNGQVVNSRLSFPPAVEAWSSFRQVSASVTLAPGRNRVRLTSIGVNGPNIDAMIVE